MTTGSVLSLGILAGVILTLFCMFCLDANRKNGEATDAELEAWREWLREREIDKQEHYIKKLWEGIARLDERERRERKERKR